MPPAFVIIGASLAGGTAAATLRQEGFDGDVILIGEEPRPPYERPPLSKKYLRGEVPFADALVRPSGFYREHGIDTRFGVAATRIDPVERRVELATGDSVRYDKLLIATGVRNRRPPIPGLDLRNVFDLRSVNDADAIRAQMVPGRKAAVIGMGFVGCEVAASLRQQGVDVVSIDPSPTPLFRVLGERVGHVVAGIHRAHGVDMVVEDVVTRFEGAERVERVITGRGRRIECDFAVVGVGVEPVVEHWQNAIQQASAAARSMLGRGQPYDAVHWFWSDQYDLNVQYAGFHQAWDEVVVRGALDTGSGIVFYLRGPRIDAAVAVNRGKDLRRIMPLIKARATVDPRQLGDEGVDLRSLVAAHLSGAHT